MLYFNNLNILRLNSHACIYRKMHYSLDRFCQAVILSSMYTFVQCTNIRNTCLQSYAKFWFSYYFSFKFHYKIFILSFWDLEIFSPKKIDLHQLIPNSDRYTFQKNLRKRKKNSLYKKFWKIFFRQNTYRIIFLGFNFQNRLNRMQKKLSKSEQKLFFAPVLMIFFKHKIQKKNVCLKINSEKRNWKKWYQLFLY